MLIPDNTNVENRPLHRRFPVFNGPKDIPCLLILIYRNKGIQTPMGIASYDNVQIAPSNPLPSAEELQASVHLVEEDMREFKSLCSKGSESPGWEMPCFCRMVFEVFAKTDVLYGEFQIRHNGIYHELRNFTFLCHEWPA